MAKPENGRRKRQAGTEAPKTQPLTLKFPMDLFNRMDAYKNETARGARLLGHRRPTWVDIICAAMEDYLKKKGA